MYMLIRKDELAQTEEEIKELERLCWEARLRYRTILKRRQQQSWWDWFFEIIGLFFLDTTSKKPRYLKELISYLRLRSLDFSRSI